MSVCSPTVGEEHLLVIGWLSPDASRSMARSFHRVSSRRDDAFLCTIPPRGVPVMLLESELFGHSVNAFQGAVRDFAGLLERVGTGTLLIDRVDLYPHRIVDRLERALRNGRAHRIGDVDGSYEVRCRVIATSPRICTIPGLKMITPPEPPL